MSWLVRRIRLVDYGIRLTRIVHSDGRPSFRTSCLVGTHEPHATLGGASQIKGIHEQHNLTVDRTKAQRQQRVSWYPDAHLFAEAVRSIGLPR